LGEFDAAPSLPAGESSGNDFRALRDKMLDAFPAPVSNEMRDAYFVQTISHALDQIDSLKTARPYLGKNIPLDYEGARTMRMPEKMSTVKKTISDMAGHLEGQIIWGHPNTQLNVVPPPTIPSIAGQLFASIYNPNIIWDAYSHRLAQSEVEVASMCADLIGYNAAEASGVFTFGGTGTTFYGVKLGLEKALPGAFCTGVRQDAKVIASDAAHYAKLSALAWLGLGTDNLVTVPTDLDNSMRLAEFESILRELLDKKQRIACIIATMGTTDAFGVDNLEFIANLRDAVVKDYKLEYRPHIHADAVIGWAWSVFNGYDFIGNPMNFPPRTLRSLWDTHSGIRSLYRADSIGVDFHKTGYTPYVSSLFLCKDRRDLDLISRDKEAMPYLFQFGSYHPGIFTMETSRFGGAVLSAWGNLNYFGKEGYRALLGYVVTIAEMLRHRIEKLPYAALVNDYNNGPVTLFRVYPDGVDSKAMLRREMTDATAGAEVRQYNDYNRRVFGQLQAMMDAGRGIALSLTDRYRVAASGEPIVALKSFVMSPYTGEESMGQLVACLDEARTAC
jgi:L-2,4-diaminobutyrate decarboxylase